MSELQENYNNAAASVKTMQGEHECLKMLAVVFFLNQAKELSPLCFQSDKLDDTIKICDKHKEKSRSLNITVAEKTREL